ncbi:MAG: hypothetical protein ACI4Q3_07170 [Kiritimatiellia bacterium]
MKNVFMPALAGLLVAGCVTATYENPPAQPPRKVVQPCDGVRSVEAPRADQASKSRPRPAAEVRAAAPGKEAAPAAPKGRATVIVKPLRVLVSIADGKPDGEPTVCKRCLQTNIEGELASAGYRVVYVKPAEILVSGSLDGGKLNSRGSRVVWRHSADMAVTRAPEVNVVNGQVMADVVAKRRFDAKSGEARSDAEAEKQSADRLGPDIARFAKEAVLRVGEQLTACEIEIANAWQPQDAAGYPSLFAQKVAAMPGVYACRVVSADDVRRTMKAEVIYETSAYPDGFVNRLYITPELNLAR